MQTLTYSLKEVPSTDFDQVIDLWSLAFNMEELDVLVGSKAARDHLRTYYVDEMSYL